MPFESMCRYDASCGRLASRFLDHGVGVTSGEESLLGLELADAIGHVSVRSKAQVFEAYFHWASSCANGRASLPSPPPPPPPPAPSHSLEAPDLPAGWCAVWSVISDAFLFVDQWGQETSLQPPLVADAWQVLFDHLSGRFYFADGQVVTWKLPPLVETPGSEFYELLGLNRAASGKEMTQAYRRSSLQCHPDKPGGDIEKFKVLRKAYDVLVNASDRCLYDRGGEVLLAFYASLEKSAELGEEACGDTGEHEWREVVPGEVFDGPQTYKMDLATGKSYVQVSGADAAASAAAAAAAAAAVEAAEADSCD